MSTQLRITTDRVDRDYFLALSVDIVHWWARRCAPLPTLRLYFLMGQPCRTSACRTQLHSQGGTKTQREKN